MSRRPFWEFAIDSSDIRKRSQDDLLYELIIFAFAMTTLLTAQLLLSAAIPGTTYRGPDGSMVQSSIFSTLQFGGFLNVTNINPLAGIGSQILPKNAWANPALWPFAFFSRETAVDLSSAVALGCFASACYVMARSFDVPILPSALAAQMCIVLFSPIALVAEMPKNFTSTPADAVCYAPYMIALGLLARLQADSSWRQFAMITAGMIACVLYSIYCDPGFTVIPAVGWAAAFATVTFCSLRLGTIGKRCAAIACCIAALTASGALIYLYTLSQYSARGQYAQTVDRVRVIEHATALFAPPLYRSYLAIAAGLLVGLVIARGRMRTLVLAATISLLFYVGYVAVYLSVLDTPWVLPVPIYIEQCLFALFIAGAVAGTWATLQAAERMSRTVPTILGASNAARQGSMAQSIFPPASGDTAVAQTRIAAIIGIALGVVAFALVPARAAKFAIRGAERFPPTYQWPWANEPELIQFLEERIALKVGRPFRGIANFLEGNEDGTIDDLRSRGVPAANEYSQTVSAPSFYFLHKFFERDVRGLLNRFEFFWRNGTYSPSYWAALQMLGVRYTVERWPLPKQFDPGLPLVTMPYHVPKQPEPEPPGFWYVYELPRPNLGDYSPTEVTIAVSGAAIMTALTASNFDFTKQVVLNSTVPQPLVPARDMRLSVIRNGLKISGHSDGTSLVVLPQQFSHCLRAKDHKVRLVRANLLLTGVVFSGDVDTDISFDYGIFSPWCRLADLADIKSLNMKIDLRRQHLTGGQWLRDWPDALHRLKEAARSAFNMPRDTLPGPPG